MRQIGLRAVAVCAVASLVCAAPAGAARSRLSESKAISAIEKQVRRQYGSTIKGRMVIAEDCDALSPRRVRCTYGAFANTYDGYQAGELGSDMGAYRFTGEGTATLTSFGTVVARVSRPHDEL